MRIEVTNISATRLFIGFTGENNHLHVAFDCGAVFAEYPDAYGQMAVKPPVGEIYPKALTREGNSLVWDVTASDCANVGDGEYQITFTQGTTVVKSFIGFYTVRESLTAEGEPPEPVDDWLIQVEQALAAFNGLTASAETLPEGSSASATVEMVNGHKNVLFGIPTGATGATGAQGERGEQGVPGTDGFSPVVDVAPITGGNRVSITDATGTESFDVMDGRNGTDGQDGAPGAPGADGVSPTVAVAPITGGHEVTITDRDGAHTFDVMNGEKGDPGTPGDPTTLIDDSATTATNKTWSANKISGDLTQLNSALNDIENVIQGIQPVEYKFSGTDLLLGFGFSSSLDYVIVMNNGRANGLFDFAKLCTKPKGTSLENLDTADLTTVWSSGTDMHGPFQFLALNNADGYHADATDAGWTGGNHTLDQMGTGFETAESVYVNYYADGTPVSSGYGKCTNFGIRWANDVQAYNTVKQGGGGRACLREYHSMVFDGETFKERIALKALEAITMKLWYGLQCASVDSTGIYKNVEFVDATNRGTFVLPASDVKSGNAVTSGFIGYGDTHRVEINVDTCVDLGKRTYYSGTKGAFATGAKGYFFIINQDVAMASGVKYYLDGSYKFLPQIAESQPEPPSETLTLNKDTITVEKVGDTDALVATHTPSSSSDVFTWTSSNTNVATVNSSGEVTVHGIGTATITVTCGNLSAVATVTQTSIKAEKAFASNNGFYISGDAVTGGSIIARHTNSLQGYGGQAYSNTDDLRIKEGTATIECIRVPYGATKLKYATTDGERHSISFVLFADTSTIITVDGKNYPAYTKQIEFLYSDTGCDVVYGEAIAFRALTADMAYVSYVYFE